MRLKNELFWHILVPITIMLIVIGSKINNIETKLDSMGAAHTSPLILSPPKAAPILEYEANVSAYCPCEKCCGQYSDGITASGHVIKKGDKFVAAPKDILLGTLIDIPGYGVVPVLDRGGAIKGNKLDVYFDTHEEALQFGRQYLIVKVLGDTK